MTIPRTLHDQISDLYRIVGDMQRRDRNRKRTGTIKEADYDKGIYRVELSKQQGDDKPFVTPWIRTRQIGAGRVKVDVLLKKGEQVDVVSESGDLTDAMIDLSTYSDNNPRANSSDSPLLITIGDTRFAMTEDKIEMVAETIILRGEVELGDIGGAFVLTVAGPATKVRAV